uniref:Uncharacterized protein n=1 Tax=Coccidioides posadasii RMSCC 3488 TaxID=454284 RepID=A0A0J6FE11_COCPO|nr:hypothetical protein CPAG_07658 [Coccidioides posadasii RMSCC 3488]
MPDDDVKDRNTFVQAFSKECISEIEADHKAALELGYVTLMKNNFDAPRVKSYNQGDCLRCQDLHSRHHQFPTIPSRFLENDTLYRLRVNIVICESKSSALIMPSYAVDARSYIVLWNNEIISNVCGSPFMSICPP